MTFQYPSMVVVAVIATLTLMTAYWLLQRQRKQALALAGLTPANPRRTITFSSNGRAALGP